MKNKLQTYFPLIRKREEILEDIRSRKELSGLFNAWAEEDRERFLNFCSGVKGIKMLYDSFFKEIMNPESTPERLNDFLSLLLKQEVKVLYVLPNDSTRIADENTLLITDIVVELEDSTLANLEVQKIGYLFTGQRSACYSSDMLLRQYKRVRSRKKKTFSYKDIKSVYTIILYEKSPKEFHEFPNTYLHYFQQKSDTGLELELLQKYLFIPLDIFRKIQHNKPINTRLEAWLTFFSTDNPDRIIQLIETWPDFRQMYQEAYQLCRNTEAVMGFFSEELRELDRNTVQLMIDEMQETIKRQEIEFQERLKEQERLYQKERLLYREERRQHQQALQRIAELEQKLSSPN